MAAWKPLRRSVPPSVDDPDARIAALVDAHGAALLRVARQYSICLDDAHDAYQRALEIYLRRMKTVDPLTEGAWMRVVVRHEAMAVRRGRTESVASEEIDFDAQVDEGSSPLEERLARMERSARSAEVLRRLKPDEASALLLKAQGHSYDEIGERHGWTYTKVNRAITEGRRRFINSYAALESGDGCETYRPALVALARGSATAELVLELRPHLRHCPACRAVVREMRGGRQRLPGWLPLPVFALGSRRPLDYAANIAESGVVPAPERTIGPSPFAALRLQLQNLLHRLQGSDVGTAVGLTSSGGGGRAASIAATIGICISSVGAGTYCVATLVLPEPKPVERRAARPPATVEPERTPTPAFVRRPAAVSAPAPTSTRTPTPPRPKARSKRKPSAPNAVRASSTPIERRHEDAPPASPAVVGQQELGIERSSARAAVQPAVAPATGGDEFSP